MNLYCFLNSLHRTYTVFLTKSGWLWKEPVVGWLWKEPVGVMCQLGLLVSEKISKQWFQQHSDTVFVLLKDSQYLINHFLEFHKVVRWHISGEVDKFTTFWCNLSSRTPYTKNYWNRSTFDRVILKNKKMAFLGHSVNPLHIVTY